MQLAYEVLQVLQGQLVQQVFLEVLDQLALQGQQVIKEPQVLKEVQA